MEITGNVLYLLSSKMNGLPDRIQLSLKIAACFGIKVTESVVRRLSESPDCAGIREGLEQAVAEGFMTKDGAACYKFVHDKVREAAYSLIPESEKNEYHHSLGITLYYLTKASDEVDDLIFQICDQINHGIKQSPIESPRAPKVDPAELTELYEKAGVKAVDCSDFGTARSYLNTALSLLPADRWKTHCDSSRRLTYLSARSAYSCGDIDEAHVKLQEVLGQCTCIEDKLPSYSLLVTILNSCGEGTAAYTTCHEVLTQLGEAIPQSISTKESTKLLDETAKVAKSITASSLLEMKPMDDELSAPLKFYSLMGTVAFFARPEMLPFVACRVVQLTMEHGISQYSIMGLVQYAAVLCNTKTQHAIQSASIIGKAAMSCLKQRLPSAEELIAKLYYTYYGLIAFHTEPLQSCADMLRQGFDAGMSIGESETAFLNAIQHTKTSLIAGEKLPTLLERMDYYLDQAETHRNELAKMYITIYRDTISTLIDKGESTSSKSNPTSTTTANSSETLFFHRAIQAFWLGHSERCHHYAGKLLSISSDEGKLRDILIAFFYGLNSFQVLKRQNTAKLRVIPKNSIAALKAAMRHSRWNFRNKVSAFAFLCWEPCSSKVYHNTCCTQSLFYPFVLQVHLLEAEHFSFLGNHEEAKASYAAAITSARCSRFVHEQVSTVYCS
ncbi:hypothetical protein ACHAWF_010187 [Thalassiosira exigua]